MLWTPPAGFRSYFSNANTPSTTPGSNIADPATANTKSSWSDISTNFPFDTDLLFINFYGYGASNSNGAALVDIGVDSTGGTTRTILLENLLAGWTNAAIGTGISKVYCIPIRIKKGSRVSWRMQGARTNGTIRVMFDAYGEPRNPDQWWTAQKCDTYGVDTADSGGTSVNVGNSSAEGTWTEITSSTTRNHRAIIPQISPDGSTTTITQLGYVFDVGIGSASSEVEIATNLNVQTHTTEQCIGPWPIFPLFNSIPQGSRLSMRGSCSGTAQGMDGAIYALS